MHVSCAPHMPWVPHLLHVLSQTSVPTRFWNNPRREVDFCVIALVVNVSLHIRKNSRIFTLRVIYTPLCEEIFSRHLVS